MNKLSYEFVKEQIEKRGCQLLTKCYNGYYHKLDIICEKGHNYKSSWNGERHGSRCPICYRKRQSKSMLKDFDYIKEFVHKEGFVLLAEKDDYKGNCSKLKCKCPNDHLINIVWSEFKRGVRCAICSGLKQKTIEEVKQYVSIFGYQCLSKTYKNWKSELEFECPEGHKYITKWHIFQQGARCPECNKIRISREQSGPNCNFWKGGISKEPYCLIWTPEFKDIIKDRDNYKCLNPVCESGKKLGVHHVNYNKKCCDKENLITLCRSCNSKANFDREWHKSWYEAILFRRYNYMY